jgi:hypothetical protein
VWRQDNGGIDLYTALVVAKLSTPGEQVLPFREGAVWIPTRRPKILR